MRQEQNHTAVQFCESFSQANVKSSIQSVLFEELYTSKEQDKISSVSCSAMACQSRWKGGPAPKQQQTQRVTSWDSQSTNFPLAEDLLYSHGHHTWQPLTFLLILYSAQPSQYFTSETLKKHHFQPQIQLQMSQLSARNGDMPFLFHFSFFLSTHCILKYSCGSLVQML